jgi:uncharacterized repeat protein (TIGR01451 family)
MKLRFGVRASRGKTTKVIAGAVTAVSLLGLSMIGASASDLSLTADSNGNIAASSPSTVPPSATGACGDDRNGDQVGDGTWVKFSNAGPAGTNKTSPRVGAGANLVMTYDEVVYPEGSDQYRMAITSMVNTDIVIGTDANGDPIYQPVYFSDVNMYQGGSDGWLFLPTDPHTSTSPYYLYPSLHPADPDNGIEANSPIHGQITTFTICVYPTTPSITLDKKIAEGGATSYIVGQTVTYTLTATNTGYVTLNDVTITDSDPTVTIGSCTPAQPADLDPLETLTCTATKVLTSTTGSYTNTATTHGTSSVDGTEVEATDSVTVDVLARGEIDIEKTLTNPAATYDGVGDVIHYTLTVTNSGLVPLTSVTVNDPNATIDSCTATLPTALQPGGSFTCSASHVLTQSDIDAMTAGSYSDFLNTASTSGNDPVGTVTDTDTINAPIVRTATVDIDKSVSDPAGTIYDSVGDVVHYTLRVTNTSNVTLTGVSVTDPGATITTCTPTQPATLAPSATMTCSAAYTITQATLDAGTYVNVATVNGTTPTGSNVTDHDDATINTTDRAELTTTKVVTNGVLSGYTVGSAVNYTITVKNTGNVTLTNVTVTDPGADAGTLVCSGPTTLQPNPPSADVITCTARHTFTAADMTAGSFTNVATGTGTPPRGPSVTDTGDTTVRAARADVGVTKTVGSATVKPNGTVSYSIKATNTGPDTATGVIVVDTLPAGFTYVSSSPVATYNAATRTLTWTVGTLTAGQSVTFTVTGSFPNLGSYRNCASATSAIPDPNPANNNSCVNVAVQVHPGTIGFWRNWRNKYTTTQLSTLLAKVAAYTPSIYGQAAYPLTPAVLDAILNYGAATPRFQQLLGQLTALELNLAVSSSGGTPTQWNDNVCPTARLNVSGISGATTFFGTSTPTIAQVITAIASRWTGKLTTNRTNWTFNLTNAQASMLINVVSGINEGTLLITTC